MTNAARHSAGSRCEVMLGADRRWSSACWTTGTGRPDHRDGVGIASMRERALEVGGSFSVGPAPEGGTLVQATLPLRGAN